jgi:hypothetical protein
MLYKCLLEFKMFWINNFESAKKYFTNNFCCSPAYFSQSIIMIISSIDLIENNENIIIRYNEKYNEK